MPSRRKGKIMKDHEEAIQSIWEQAQGIADFAAYCGFEHRKSGYTTTAEDYQTLLRYTYELLRMIRAARG